MLLTMMGIANTIGRLVAGRVGDLVDRRMLFASCMLIGGANVMFLGFDIPYWLLALLLVVFSVFGGAFVAMFPVSNDCGTRKLRVDALTLQVLVTDSFGAKRVSSTIGMLMATVAPGNTHCEHIWYVMSGLTGWCLQERLLVVHWLDFCTLQQATTIDCHLY